MAKALLGDRVASLSWASDTKKSNSYYRLFFMIVVRNLTKKFSKDFTAVNDISFTINPGDVVGLLGPNGAGKTTTMQMLLDVLTPTAGSIHYFGLDLHKHRSTILQDVAFGSAYTSLPGRLTVRENLEIFGRLYGVSGAELHKRIAHYLELFGIADRANQEVGSMSAGQKTRAMLAKTFLVHPKIVFLDEPTSSLDPDIALEVRSLIIKQQKEYGLTVVMASHNMDEVAAICNRVIVLSKGTIIADASPLELAQSVANVQIHLVVVDGLKRALSYCKEMNYATVVRERELEIAVDEHKISAVLAALAQAGVEYSAITIAKPTLEHYFLQIARAARNGSVIV